MRTHMHHLTAALVAALIAWSSPAPLPASDYEASDFLPLAVGNSWTFQHEVYDSEGMIFDQRNLPWQTGVVTITVERTEVTGDTTYYVLSDLPSGWAPAPPHCPVGKKLRWKGSELMERTDTGERSLFRFGGDRSYTIPLTHGDDEVERRGTGPTIPVPGYSFWFHGYDGWAYPGYSGRYVGFLAGYGLEECTEFTDVEGHAVYGNILMPVEATLVEASNDGTGGVGGQSGTTTRTVNYWDAHKGPPSPASSTSSRTWGQLKGSSR